MKFTRYAVPALLVIVALVLMLRPTPSAAPTTPSSPGGNMDAESRGADSAEPIESSSLDALDLSPSYTVGERRRYLAVTRTEALTPGADGGTPARNLSEFFFVITFETLSHGDDGTVLSMTYDRIRSRSYSPGFNMETDSARDAGKAVSTIQGSYRRTTGVPITLTLDANGEFVDAVSELSDFGVEEDMFALARYLHMRDGILFYAGPIFAHAGAPESIGVNESWTRYLRDYLGPQRKRWIETEQTVMGVRDGNAEITFAGIVQTADQDADVPDPAFTPLEPNYEGTYSWDLRDGALESAEIVERYEQETTIPESSEPLLVRGRINKTIRRVDESFTLDQLLAELSKVGFAQGPRPDGAANIDALCARAVTQHEQPAIGAAAFGSEGIVAFGMRGVRNNDTRESVATDGLFNVGFVTTNMLATAIGAMVDDGVLSWDMTLPAALADVAHEGYGGVTLEQFLRNEAGVVGYNSLLDEKYARLPEMIGHAPEERVESLRVILAEPPAFQPGARAESSAASTCVAVVIAEQATGKPWSELFHEYLLGPLSLRSARLEWPATSATPDGTRGHLRPSGRAVPIEIGQAPRVDPLRRPATGLSLSLADFAAYGAHELAALRGESAILSQAIAERIHDTRGGTRSTHWFHEVMGNGRQIRWTRSVSGGFACLLILVPEIDLGVAVVTNAGDGSNAAMSLALEVMMRDPRMQTRNGSIGPMPSP